MTSFPVVAVLGASGGLGASTWAAALARRLSVHLGECVLVDGDLGGGGLDMTCGTEHVPGLRWPDLAQLRGVTSCERLVAALPRAEVPVLSASGRGLDVQESVVHDVLASLVGQVPLVIDVPVTSALCGEVVSQADAVHVLSGVRARQVADTESVLRVLGGGLANVGLVTRAGRVGAAALADLVSHLSAPHLGHVRDDPRVQRDGERGEWPGLRGPLRDSADRVVLDLLDVLERGDSKERAA